MLDTPVLGICLVLMTICLVSLTVTMMGTTRELRRTLRRVNALPPGAHHALREVNRSLEQVRDFLTKVNTATRRVEMVIHQASDAAEDALHRLATLKDKAHTFLGERFGNGAGAEPRPHHRRR